MTARHIDSHDTFWWPLPGFKWRREQYGLPAARALLATWSLIGGVYMTFVGGETAMEEEIRRLHRLRADLPEIRIGIADYDGVRADDDHIFAVARRHRGQTSLVLVNLSPSEVRANISVADSIVQPDRGTYRLNDAWNDMSLDHPSGYVWDADQLASFALTFAPYQARVLTMQPAS